ncbi:Fe-S cluster assembly protein SufD [Buchananella hordeovulneris]|uniref:Fe-S cluster assembly protein SufD n=1 Tax=Buchananella hordeovulneris TaxID=52770 RepID=UPI000F5FB7C6|nr:Fe-S cluster assembly protein SufD [Buchananella hordeovulneris]RRD45543.1 Fe-S cluster assembly protein SufD [Buchananella hordeovulneris]
MNASTDHSRAQLVGAHSDGRGVTKPEGSRADRRTSFNIDDFALPTGREEEWRFTPITQLEQFFTPTPVQEHGINWQVLHGGADVASLRHGQQPRDTVLTPADRLSAIAAALTDEALYLTIPAGRELAEPVRVNIAGIGRSETNYGHVVVEARTGSRAVVILDHTGSARLNGNVEIKVEDEAELTVVSLQRWNDDAIHTGEHKAVVGKDANFKHVAVTLGGALVRLNANVAYTEQGGSAHLLGVYFADAGQHLEHRSFVDHNTANCVSRVTYKGALQGQDARTVWVGDVLIRAEALGTDSYEQNRNLVLTEGARADSIPNLEIETGQIEGAGHASATGRFDDNQLFYLMSRGIDEATARRLVVHGFFAEVVNEIGVPEVVELVMAAIEAELDSAQAARAAV